MCIRDSTYCKLAGVGWSRLKRSFMASVLPGVVQLMSLTAATVTVAVVAEGQLLAEVVEILLVQPANICANLGKFW